MAKMKYWNGTTWEVAGTDADKVELKDNNDLFQANNVEDALVEIKQDLDTHKADYVPHLGTTTNDGNGYTVTSPVVINEGYKFSVKFNEAATDVATLTISSDGVPRALKKPGGGDFKPKAGIYTFIRDGVNFQCLGEGGEYGNAAPEDVAKGVTFGTEDGLKVGTNPYKVGEIAPINKVIKSTEVSAYRALSVPHSDDLNITADRNRKIYAAFSKHFYRYGKHPTNNSLVREIDITNDNIQYYGSLHCDGYYIYVSETSGKRLIRFDSDGNQLAITTLPIFCKALYFDDNFAYGIGGITSDGTYLYKLDKITLETVAYVKVDTTAYSDVFFSLDGGYLYYYHWVSSGSTNSIRRINTDLNPDSITTIISNLPSLRQGICKNGFLYAYDVTNSYFRKYAYGSSTPIVSIHPDYGFAINISDWGLFIAAKPALNAEHWKLNIYDTSFVLYTSKTTSDEIGRATTVSCYDDLPFVAVACRSGSNTYNLYLQDLNVGYILQ